MSDGNPSPSKRSSYVPWYLRPIEGDRSYLNRKSQDDPNLLRLSQ